MEALKLLMDFVIAAKMEGQPDLIAGWERGDLISSSLEEGEYGGTHTSPISQFSAAASQPSGEFLDSKREHLY